jgi:membrane-bound lytic murein transglycosylase C
MKREIEQKWNRAVRSTRKEWVDYSPGYDARSIVDFEKGVVEVAALVPVPKGQALKPGEAAAAAGAEIAKQFARVLSEQGQAGRPVMAGQVATKAGRPVGRQNAEAFVRKEVLPSVVVDGSPTESRDGLTRVKVTATVKMTPDHLKKRAQQYLDVVRANAKRQRLDPRLVLAVIHTESYFNPKAQSPVPAYGLMQLVPRAAARDAYNYLYQDDRVLDPEYLTDPAHNVELGAAYLRILMSQIFSEIPEGEKRNYLVICAYNWGPGNIRNKVVSRHRVKDLSEAQLFLLLTESTPEETRNYLKRVTERRALYEELVGR